MANVIIVPVGSISAKCLMSLDCLHYLTDALRRTKDILIWLWLLRPIRRVEERRRKDRWEAYDIFSRTSVYKDQHITMRPNSIILRWKPWLDELNLNTISGALLSEIEICASDNGKTELVLVWTTVFSKAIVIPHLTEKRGTESAKQNCVILWDIVWRNNSKINEREGYKCRLRSKSTLV